MDELLAFRQRHRKNRQNLEEDKHHDAHEKQHPYINQYDELIIPFGSSPKYHYWNGGQNLEETLLELGVSEKILSKYYN